MGEYERSLSQMEMQIHRYSATDTDTAMGQSLRYNSGISLSDTNAERSRANAAENSERTVSDRYSNLFIVTLRFYFFFPKKKKK